MYSYIERNDSEGLKFVNVTQMQYILKKQVTVC